MADTKQPGPAAWLDALAGSHDRLAERAADLDADGLRRQSYCTDWSVAQVFSHIGSGAEIFKLVADAVIAGKEPPGNDAFPAIWERWNSFTPEQQVEECVAADGALVETLEGMGDGLDDFRALMFGALEVDAVGFLGMRLGEHALHLWDIVVTFEPAATVDPECVHLLIDRVPLVGAWMGKAERAGADRPFEVKVATTAPARRFSVSVGDDVHIAPKGARSRAAGTADLTVPAEALLRLVYGRLDPDHSPEVSPDQVATLDRLRLVFPGA